MTAFRSNIDPDSEEFRRNAEANRAQAEDLRRLHEEIEQGGA